jgi:ketosteroid isomerase-like protein
MVTTVDELLDLATTALLGDAAVLQSVADADLLLLGTDPGEEFEGAPSAVAAMAGQVESMGTAVFVSEHDRRVRELGDVAWFAEHGQLRFGDQGLRVRLTGVAVRRDGGWKLAQLQAAPCHAAVDLEAMASGPVA